MPQVDPEAAEAKAELWLRQNGMLILPVDPHDVAAPLDIEVRAKRDTARCLRHAPQARRQLRDPQATHIPSIGYQRFSIGRELGHYLLEGHAELLFPNGDGVHAS